MQDRVLTLRVPDGRKMALPVGVWFLALYDLLNEDDKLKLFNNTEKIYNDNIKEAQKARKKKIANKKTQATYSMAAEAGGMECTDTPRKMTTPQTDDEFLESLNIKPFQTSRQMNAKYHGDYWVCDRVRGLTCLVICDDNIIVWTSKYLKKFTRQPMCNLMNWLSNESDVRQLPKTLQEFKIMSYREAIVLMAVVGLWCGLIIGYSLG